MPNQIANEPKKEKRKKKKELGNKFLGKTADIYNTFSVYILEEISNLLFGLSTTLSVYISWRKSQISYLGCMENTKEIGHDTNYLKVKCDSDEKG